jgi:hypothetical protein
MDEAIRLENMRSRFERMEVANALKTLDIVLPRLELEIQNARNIGGSNSNLVELQHEITTLTMKYELFQQEAFEFNKGRWKLEQE